MNNLYTGANDEIKRDISFFRVAEASGKFWIEQQEVYEVKRGWPFSYTSKYNHWVCITEKGFEYEKLEDAYADIQKVLKGEKTLPVNYHYFNK